MLGGLTSPTRGEVTLSGAPLASLDAAARGEVRAHAVGYAFQTANLLPSFTAFENVAFARHVSRGSGELGPADLLALVGLSAKLDALPGELSGGEAQRVAIARALAQEPKLLLCDEPTGQLDSDTGGRVLDLIAALHDRLRFALVIATHDPDVAARSDRVVTLEDGRLVTDQVARFRMRPAATLAITGLTRAPVRTLTRILVLARPSRCSARCCCSSATRCAR